MEENRPIYKEYKDYNSSSLTRLFDEEEKKSILNELGYKKYIVKGYTSHSVYHNDIEYSYYSVEIYLREKWANYYDVINGEGKANELYQTHGLDSVFAKELNSRLKEFIISKLFDQ